MGKNKSKQKKDKQKEGRKKSSEIKHKLPLYAQPELFTGTLCASQSETADKDGSPLQVHPKDVDLKDFFCDDFKTDEEVMSTARKLKDIGRYCLRALSSDVKEEDLRDAVFTELLQRGILFPPRSQCTRHKDKKKQCSPDNSLNPVSVVEQSKRYAYEESAMRVLLSSASDFVVTKGETTSMDRLMNGLLVTTSSLPDMAPFQPVAEEFFMIRMGEFKNKAHYTKTSATRQCFAYLYVLLYWIRVVHGIPLKSVYGFGFCGKACGDSKGTYSVGLFRLTAPKHLGQVFCAEQHWQDFKTGSSVGVKLLHLYLTRGRLWDMTEAGMSRIEPEKRVPALFGAPQAYWNDRENAVLVRNGTRAIVLRVSQEGLSDALQDALTVDSGGPHRHLPRFVNEVLREVERQVKGTGRKPHFYVKVRSLDTSYHFDRGEFDVLYTRSSRERYRKDCEAFCADFQETYLAEPFTSDKCVIIVMADRGEKITEQFTSGVAKHLLRPLRDYMREMVEFMFHGDFLSHNFLLDNAHCLRVIDHDEGGIEKIGRRFFDVQNEDLHWHAIIRYPNALRYNAKEYTEVQFVAAVLQLVSHQLEDLVQVAMCLGETLLRYERRAGKGATKQPPMLHGRIERDIADQIAALNREVENFLDSEITADERAEIDEWLDLRQATVTPEETGEDQEVDTLETGEANQIHKLPLGGVEETKEEASAPSW